jgi:hypothetical protein
VEGVSKKKPLTLDDVEEIQLNAGQAFLAMGKFLGEYFERTHGKGALAVICTDIEVEHDRMSTDPAALSDWHKAVVAVVAEARDT